MRRYPGREAPLDPVRWDTDALKIIDQRFLPGELRYRRCEDVESVAEAIETLAVRGAPAIGIAAAYGVVLGALSSTAGSTPHEAVTAAIERLRRTRPTAVNLFHVLDHCAQLAQDTAPDALVPTLLAEANRVLDEDLDSGRRIGDAGADLFPATDPVRVLTHCNAGGLATGGWGTALAPLYVAAARGREVLVLADETRPLLQGSRLTAWELSQAGIPVKVLVDGAVASVLSRGGADLVIVGADRVAANGDTANKIGTFSVALAAREAGVPFYVAAPLSTFDPETSEGRFIPVEERGREEVVPSESPPEIEVLNPAFDVTPASLIAGWITENGVLQPPFTRETLFGNNS